MYKPFYLVAFLLPIPSFADFTFSGSFSQDDIMLEYQFTIAATSTITLESFSYGGDGGSVPAGGFAPVLSLFSPAGSSDPTLLNNSLEGGACGVRTPDNGLCLDAYLQEVEGPGSYLVFLTEYDNLPQGGDLASGFARTGQGNFTGPEFLSAPGAFIDEFGNQRTPNFDFTISGADSAMSLPEPSTVSLFIAGLGLLAFKRKRTSR